MRSVAPPYRRTEWPHKECVCSCQEAGRGCITGTLQRTVFSGSCLLFLFLFFLNWEAGSFPFLAVPKQSELPTLSTRRKHGQHSCRTLPQAAGRKRQQRLSEGHSPTLSSIHSVCSFSSRKKWLRGRAFADCFSNGSSFLPNSHFFTQEVRSSVECQLFSFFFKWEGVFHSSFIMG